MFNTQLADALKRKRLAFAPESPFDAPAEQPSYNAPPTEEAAPFDADSVETVKIQPPEQIAETPFAADHQAADTLIASTPNQQPHDVAPDADKAELAAADEQDRRARYVSGLALAIRQLNAGLTGRSVGEGMPLPPSEVDRVQKSQALRRQQVAEALQRQRQARMDDLEGRYKESEITKNLRVPGVKPEDPVATKLKEAQTEHVAALTEDLKNKPERDKEKANRLAAALKKKQEAAAKAEGVAMESSKIPAFGGMFVPREGTKPDKELAKQASLHAGLYNAAVTGMDDLAGAVKAYVAHPSPDTKREIDAKVSGVAAAVTAAHGGGAMADSEFERQKNALGADPTSVAALQSLISEALGSPDGAKSLISKLDSSRSSLIEMAKGRLAPSNYEFRPGPGAAATKQSPGAGYIRGKTKSGKPGWFNPQTHDFQAD